MDGMADAPDGDSMDAVIALYRAAVDRTLLRENLRRTPLERLRRLVDLGNFVARHRGAARGAPPPATDHMA
jgi:hypothetical protein